MANFVVDFNERSDELTKVSPFGHAHLVVSNLT